MSGDNHTVSFKTYLNILLALLFLTAVTVAVAQIDFGWFNAFIAMLIATIKGALVLLYFMHLKYDDDKFYWVIFGSGVFMVILLFILSKVDIATRVLEVNTL